MICFEIERGALKSKREELKLQKEALKLKYDEKAKEICPFSIGDRIEYEPGKEGVVEEIYFLGKDYINLEEQEPTTWGVTGRKINKDGKYGKKKFKPVSNASHVVKGKRCKRKTLNEEFGIEESS